MSWLTAGKKIIFPFKKKSAQCPRYTIILDISFYWVLKRKKNSWQWNTEWWQHGCSSNLLENLASLLQVAFICYLLFKHKNVIIHDQKEKNKKKRCNLEKKAMKTEKTAWVNERTVKYYRCKHLIKMIPSLNRNKYCDNTFNSSNIPH